MTPDPSLAVQAPEPATHLQQVAVPVDVVEKAPMPWIFAAVHGIISNPADSRVWDHRFVTFINKFTRHKGDNLPYVCGPISRAWHQQERIDNLVLLLRQYAECKIVMVGHSNGCAIILKGLADADYPRIEHLHLFNGACAADFNANGLNGALRRGDIGQVSVYVAGKDKALQAVSRLVLARLIGYGTLGLHGPVNVAPDVSDRVHKVAGGQWQLYGHSSCWSVYNFKDTMGLITA